MGLHPEEHPLDIGVLADGHALGVRVQHLGDMDALEPVLRVGCGVHVRGAGNGQSLHADAQTGLVHHLEHDLHALPFFAQEEAHAFAVVAEAERAGRGTLDAHLVLDTGAVDVIVLAQRAVRVSPGIWER